MATRTVSPSRLRLLIVLLAASACSSGGIECDDAAIRQVVEEFSMGLQELSYSSRGGVSAYDLTEAYDGSVTAGLLASWVENPDKAPGRYDAGRWPAGLEVTSIRGLADACRVEVDVKWVRKSTETSGPALEPEPAILRVVQSDDGAWQVADYRLDSE